MLQFILGRASSGKTYMVTQKIAECITNGESPILLVPEQFSFESEKNILDMVGDSAAGRVSVVSFTRLCDEIERVVGGVCGESITDADRIILMNKAIKNCQSDLVRFRKYATSRSFARLMIDSIGEFKMNFVSVEDLRSVAENIDDEQLRLKLLDTALIYENYDAIIAEKFIDSTDRLTKLYYALQQYRYFDGKTVFIDSFKGFSGQQYKIIERILSQASNVIVTLCDNPYDTREFGIFANIKRVKSRISSIAQKNAVCIEKDIVLNDKHYNSEQISALEDFMATGSTSFGGETRDITICCAESIYSEADFVARNIRRIVRETGARYSDFVIIARDTATYEDALDTACKKNNVSCFIDKRIPLIDLPTAVSILAAANIAQNFTTENILRFHKSGIGVLSVDEIATLENYAYIWNIDGMQWQNEWTMDPDGFNAYEELSEAKKEKLRQLNLLRNKAIEPLKILKTNFKDNAKNMASSLMHVLEKCEADKSFKKLSKQYGSNIYQDAIKQSWDKIMSILDSLCLCFGETDIKKSEFCDALKTALSFETVGVIPQMIDEAVFGAADRIRPSRPKYAFIMGANQGVFPRIQQNEGLFANGERERLINLGLDIPDKVFAQAVDEECLLYSNVCCAVQGVFISYSTALEGISDAQPSSFVVDIKEKFNCNILLEPSVLGEKGLPESREDAFSMLCGNLSESSTANTLIESLKNSDMDDRINGVLDNRYNSNFAITDTTAGKLFGEKIKMSPSKFDSFNRCRFMYFCRYGLRVERLQPAEFNAMQRGTVVHYVLQRIVEDCGKTISQFSNVQIAGLVDKYIGEYLNNVAGYEDIETPYLKYLITTIKRSLRYVVERLALEFKQSDFEPIKCELKIGCDGDLPEIQIPIDDSGSLALTGMIDRLDHWNGYIRIVDYKTGSRKFRLPDILFGQNMQMLIYLYAISRSEQFGGKSAGILYMPASRDKDDKKSERRMNGLIAANQDLVTAMDKDNKGEFIPIFKEDAPSSSFIHEEDFDTIFKYIEKRLVDMGRTIYNGDVSADPVDGIDSGACKYCEYQNICHVADASHQKVPKLTNREVIEEIERQVSEDGI